MRLPNKRVVQKEQITGRQVLRKDPLWNFEEPLGGRNRLSHGMNNTGTMEMDQFVHVTNN